MARPKAAQLGPVSITVRKGAEMKEAQRLRDAVTVARQAVFRVREIVEGAPLHVKAVAGKELAALATALDAIVAAQVAMFNEIEGGK